MSNASRRYFLRYVVPLATVSFALLITIQLDFLARRTPFALFFAAVGISTWYGGRGPGLLAIATAVLASDYFVIPPYSLWPYQLNWLEEITFIAVSFLIVFLTLSRERTEKQLREIEQRDRIIIESVSDAIITIDEKSTILFVNRAAEKIFGYSESDMVGKNLTMLMPDYLREVHTAGIGRYLKTGERHLDWNSVEVTALRRDGREMPVELSFGESVKDGERNFTGVVRDITERKQEQDERERFFSLSGDLLLVAGFDGRFRWVSAAWEHTLGWTSDDLTTRSWLDFVHPDDYEKTMAEAEKLFKGQETVSFENRYRQKDGSYRWISWKSRAYIAEELIYAVASDISERKLLEEQLRQAQKLESIGQLAGGVAHDFNNLLTVIIGYSELALSRTGDGDPVGQHLQDIINAAENAASLTRQLLAFSRKQVLQPTILDLTQTISDTHRMLKRLIGENIELMTLLEPNLARVAADAGQIEQVLMNLVINARDAMPQGGKLTIETRNATLGETYSNAHVSVTPGPYVMLAVSDTGHGMDKSTLEHIFEPFFTTRERGKGTGLGLSTVYGIIKQSGGNIWVYSEPGCGTTFKIYLPVVEGEIERRTEVDRTSKLRGGTETVLVVEDEDSVRTLLVDVLAAEGYNVLSAARGSAALTLCEQYKGSIQILVTDVVMPGMSGRELVERLEGKCRDVKVLYMSGYTDDAIVHHGILDTGVAFLQKPFTPAVALKKIREVLESSD